MDPIQIICKKYINFFYQTTIVFFVTFSIIDMSFMISPWSKFKSRCVLAPLNECIAVIIVSFWWVYHIEFKAIILHRVKTESPTSSRGSFVSLDILTCRQFCYKMAVVWFRFRIKRNFQIILLQINMSLIWSKIEAHWFEFIKSVLIKFTVF